MANNLRYFRTNQEYQAADLVLPAVSYVEENGKIIYDEASPTPPTFQGKWLATYIGGTTASAECDSTSAITQDEITLENLEAVDIGDCVTSIGTYVFENCSSLTSVTIPDSVTSIGNGAFYNCFSLVSATIGDNVTSIGEWAFYGDGLASMTCLATVPPTLGSYAIADTSIAYGEGYIYVPAESVNLYKEANGWSDYASRIQAIS